MTWHGICIPFLFKELDFSLQVTVKVLCNG